MMDVKIFVGLVINVEVERGEVGCGTSGDEHGVGGKESQLFTLKRVIVLFQAGGELMSKVRICEEQTSLRVI